MSKLVSVDQLTQLQELERARVRAQGVGYADEFQRFLNQIRSGGVSPGTADSTGKRRKRRGQKLPDRDPRILQWAKRLWNKGWGDVRWWKDPRGDTRGAKDFAEYLATIPDLPQFPETWDERFPHLVLVDRRATLTEACQMCNVRFDGTNDTFVPYDPDRSITDHVYWMRCQDGKIHRNRKPSDCRAEFAAKGDEVGGEAHEGLALYAQAPDLLDVGTAWDLAGSVRADDRRDCVYLARRTDGGVVLHWLWSGHASPVFGSVSRGSAALKP